MHIKIKDYCKIWPPIFAIGAASMDAALADTVFSVRGYAGTKDLLVLSARDQSGVTYVVPLVLPTDVVERAIIVIPETLPMTLRELGELNI